jgi:hypothetical protein
MGLPRYILRLLNYLAYKVTVLRPSLGHKILIYVRTNYHVAQWQCVSCFVSQLYRKSENAFVIS